jgi:uncharacterized membrane protein YgdD (TMEM256/DUF423 family)
MSGWDWVRAGAVLGFLGVGLGAFGAHGLKETLARLETAATYQTAVQYHLVHALAILAVGVVGLSAQPRPAMAVAGWAFLVGVVVFSGSLYVLSVTGMKWLGAITPIGGVAFLAGWLALAVAAGGAAPAAVAQGAGDRR